MYGENEIFNNSSHPIKVAYVSGADLMVSKSLFIQLNGFSPEFFMYYEETDLCYRVKKMGYQIFSVPSAEIMHLEGGSQKKDFAALLRKTEISTASRQIFMRRNHGNIYNFFDRMFLNIFYKVRILLKRDIELSNVILLRINN